VDLRNEIINPVLKELADEILARNITVECQGMDFPAKIARIHEPVAKL